MDAQLCRSALQNAGREPPAVTELDDDDWLDLVAGELVYPALGQHGIAFVYDYPANQAALARIRPDEPPVAERFEAFVRGVELANGFHELADPDEQRRRFEGDLERRRDDGLPMVPMDEHLLQALGQGFPDCAGVALGFDRLAMLATDAVSVENVIAFPWQRA
jgi:lysyl-tRNA synthetase class 2